jgi:hypothetical protein
MGWLITHMRGSVLFLLLCCSTPVAVVAGTPATRSYAEAIAVLRATLAQSSRYQSLFEVQTDHVYGDHGRPEEHQLLRGTRWCIDKCVALETMSVSVDAPMASQTRVASQGGYRTRVICDGTDVYFYTLDTLADQQSPFFVGLRRQIGPVVRNQFLWSDVLGGSMDGFVTGRGPLAVRPLDELLELGAAVARLEQEVVGGVSCVVWDAHPLGAKLTCWLAPDRDWQPVRVRLEQGPIDGFVDEAGVPFARFEKTVDQTGFEQIDGRYAITGTQVSDVVHRADGSSIRITYRCRRQIVSPSEPPPFGLADVPDGTRVSTEDAGGAPLQIQGGKVVPVVDQSGVGELRARMARESAPGAATGTDSSSWFWAPATAILGLAVTIAGAWLWRRRASKGRS